MNSTATTTPTRRKGLRRWLSARGRSLDITKSGWLFIVACLAVGFVAINSGSNLMHAIFGAQLGLIVASGWLSELMLGRVRVRLRLEGDAHAETDCPVSVEIENLHPKSAAMAISVVLDDDRSSATRIDPVFVPSVAPASRYTAHSQIRFARRGPARAPALVVCTGYPFGLFVKRRQIDAHLVATVFPAVADNRRQAPRDPQPHVPRGVESHLHRLEHGTGDEFHGLSEYRHGESPSLIHWRASARRGELVVARYEARENDAAYIRLAPGTTGNDEFEARVRTAARQSVELTRGETRALGLRYGDDALVEPGRGPQHARRLLHELAMVGERAAA